MQKLYKVVLLQRFNDELSIVKSIESNEIKPLIRYRNKSYKLNLNNVGYVNKIQKIYFLNIENGSQYTFIEIKAEMNPDQLDVLMATKIIKELASGIIDNKKEKILMILIGFIIGLILGLLIMQIISSDKIEQILLENMDNAIVIPFDSLTQSIKWWID